MGAIAVKNQDDAYAFFEEALAQSEVDGIDREMDCVEIAEKVELPLEPVRQAWEGWREEQKLKKLEVEIEAWQPPANQDEKKNFFSSEAQTERVDSKVEVVAPKLKIETVFKRRITNLAVKPKPEAPEPQEEEAKKAAVEFKR